MEENQAEIKRLRGKISRLRMVELPGLLLFGTGIFALSPKNGNDSGFIIQNDFVAYGAVISGLAVVLYCGAKKFKLIRQKSELQNRDEGGKE